MPIQGFSHFVQTYEYDCDSLAWKNLCLQFYLAVLFGIKSSKSLNYKNLVLRNCNKKKMLKLKLISLFQKEAGIEIRIFR